MSLRRNYLERKEDVLSKSIDIQIELDKNSAEREIIELKDRVGICKAKLLQEESRPKGFDLKAVIAAEVALEVAEDDLKRAKKTKERLFGKNEGTSETISSKTE